MAEADKSVTIDGKSYPLATLSPSAKGNLASLQATDAELRYLGIKTAICQTARIAYIKALKDELENGSSTDERL